MLATFPARFPSVCPVCRILICVGEQIAWGKGRRARHATCHRDETKPVLTDAPTGCACIGYKRKRP